MRFFNKTRILDYLLKLSVSAFAVVITAYLIPGVKIDDFTAAVKVAFLLSIFNTFLKPVLVIFTIPITLYTLGLFLLVINTGIIMLTDHYIKGFTINGWGWALLFSIILSLVTSILENISKPARRENY